MLICQVLPVQHPSHHGVDLLDSQAQVGSLEACVEVRLQQDSVVHALVEVVALDHWCTLW